jgi:hypothetical protein
MTATVICAGCTPYEGWHGSRASRRKVEWRVSVRSDETNCGELGEAEVAGWAERSLSNSDIAAVLVIYQHTVEAHIDRVLGKLGFNSRARLAPGSPTTPAAPG